MMLIKRAYRTEMAPTEEQLSLCAQHAGVARFVWNWGLGRGQEIFKETGKRPSVYELKKELTALKPTLFPWMNDVSTYAAQSAFDDLQSAWANFFRELKKFKAGARKEMPGFPRFKSKGKCRVSFRLYGSIHVEDGSIQLPRIGVVKLKEKGYLPASDVKILNVTVSEQAGRWFASLQVEQELADPPARAESTVGVDLGIKTLAVCSDGQVFENPKALKAAKRKLARLEREKSRRQKGSANRKKTVAKLANAHYRVSNIRKDALHQATHRITQDHTAIVLEDLNVKGMVKNHHLAGAVSDASFAEFRRQVEYKAAWRGGTVLLADRWMPSSKTCSECGTVKTELKLSQRTFTCESCGIVLDRDMNAAHNLRKLAVRTAESLNACGDGGYRCQ